VKLSTTTIVLFCLAGLCYATSWTAVGTGLVIFGVFFEVCAWLSLFPEAESKSTEPTAGRKSEETHNG
jgi:hypothetical protein